MPPSRETSVASMSQTSGGEAGSPPPAVVAAGMHFILPYWRELEYYLANMNSAGKILIKKSVIWGFVIGSFKIHAFNLKFFQNNL